MIGRGARAAGGALCAIAVAVLPAGPAPADRIRDDQWHLRYLHVTEAHQFSKGAGVTVAVVDTGVDRHPDLRHNLLRGTDIGPGGTGDGQRDDNSHGTEMAGLIAAHGQTIRGGALGLAPQAKVLPVRVMTQSGDDSADPEAIGAGIEWAVEHGAQVISMSFGGGSSTRMINALAMATRADVVLIAGAGNRPKVSGVSYPAAADGVVAVGATDRNGNRAVVSVAGPQMALVAPGVDIYSTSIGGKYGKSTGTSDSTAIVAGAVLVKAGETSGVTPLVASVDRERVRVG